MTPTPGSSTNGFDCDVAVVGAGPQGLAAAAHLRQAGVEARVFGDAMAFWTRHMPRGMLLRSSPRASNISDPRHAFTLRRFRELHDLRPAAPVPLESFVDYGRWFARQVVPDLDPRRVTAIEPRSKGLRIRLQDGEALLARRVVVAAGIARFAHRPRQFDGVPAALASHSTEHRDFSGFAGRHVIVVGGGQSALESAALLRESRADVEAIIRGRSVVWLRELPDHRGRLGRAVWKILHPPTEVGPPGFNWIVAVPGLFRLLPRSLRSSIAYRCYRPAAASWLRPRLDGVRITTGREIVSAASVCDRIRIRLDDGTERSVDHVVLATGYRVDLARYEFLSPPLLKALSLCDGSPVLGPAFESSVAGLHFIGASAAQSFGPVMYFVVGGAYAGPALARAVLGGPPPLGPCR